jgi:hypothetical protein
MSVAGRDAQQVVVSVGVRFVDPQSYGILVTRFAGLDQVAKPHVVDRTFRRAWTVISMLR